MLFLRKNFCGGLLSATVGIPDTTMNLLAGHNLPTTAGTFVCVLWNGSLYASPSLDPNAEFVLTTYLSPNVYTITRAQEGTVAVPHAINDKVSMTYSAAVSTADLSILGTKQINEAAIANGYLLSYDSGTGKIVYIAPPSPIVPNPPYAAGDFLIMSSDTSRTITASVYTKSKEIILARPGTLRIKFDLNFTSGPGGINGKIYRNGVAVGTERTRSSAGSQTFTEDVAGWSAGDLIQIYVKIADPSDVAALSNFRIYSTIPTVESVTTDAAV